MKRRVSILLFVLIIASLFSFGGCSKDTNDSNGGSNNSGDSTNPVTIEFWHNYDAGSGQVETLNKLIAEFESAHKDIKVKQVYLEWEALKNNVVSGASTGTLPDVLRGDIAFVPQFQSLNVLEEMSSLEGFTEAANKLLEGPNSTAKMGDKYYGIASNTNTKILFYNKTILESANLQAPNSLEELWSTAEKLSNGDVIGMVEPWTGVWNIGPYIWSEGGDVLSPDNSTAEGYINSQISIDVVQKLADLYKEKALAGPSMDPGAVGDTDGWAAGKYALQLDGPWRANSNKDANIDFGAMPLPNGNNGSISVLGGEDFMLFKTSDEAHKKAAWEFVKFMTDEHAQVEMAKVGQMPVNKAALENQDSITAMPLLPVFSEALKTAKSRPVTPLWSDMENIIATKVAEAITGQKDVKAALDEAAQEIDKLISDN